MEKFNLEEFEMEIKEVISITKNIELEIQKHMVGQEELVRQLLLALFSGGNVLLEGLPGLGKTRLVKTLGRVLGLQFSRVQFTPDLMPADITGTNILVRQDEKQGFSFQKGPIFSNIVLADEINRATPKTQSAMLEAMQEATVTVAGVTYKMPQPFFVIATQNPIEQEGTYPLPEAQLDRFMFKLYVPYPKLEDLIKIAQMLPDEQEEYSTVATVAQILKIRDAIEKIVVAKPVMEFAAKLIMVTHSSKESPDVTKSYIRYGASPRGVQTLIKTAKAKALMEGRYNVSFDDIKYVAYPTLRHRIFLNFEGVSSGMDTDAIIEILINEVGKLI